MIPRFGPYTQLISIIVTQIKLRNSTNLVLIQKPVLGLNMMHIIIRGPEHHAGPTRGVRAEVLSMVAADQDLDLTPSLIRLTSQN